MRNIETFRLNLVQDPQIYPHLHRQQQHRGRHRTSVSAGDLDSYQATAGFNILMFQLEQSSQREQQAKLFNEMPLALYHDYDDDPNDDDRSGLQLERPKTRRRPTSDPIPIIGRSKDHPDNRRSRLHQPINDQMPKLFPLQTDSMHQRHLVLEAGEAIVGSPNAYRTCPLHQQTNRSPSPIYIDAVSPTNSDDDEYDDDDDDEDDLHDNKPTETDTEETQFEFEREHIEDYKLTFASIQNIPNLVCGTKNTTNGDDIDSCQPKVNDEDEVKFDRQIFANIEPSINLDEQQPEPEAQLEPEIAQQQVEVEEDAEAIAERRIRMIRQIAADLRQIAADYEQRRRVTRFRNGYLANGARYQPQYDNLRQQQGLLGYVFARLSHYIADKFHCIKQFVHNWLVQMNNLFGDRRRRALYDR